jgi:kumamolisin
MSTASSGVGEPPAGYAPLEGSERKPRPGYHAAGPAGGDEQVRVVVKLRPSAPPPDPAALGALRPSARPAPDDHDAHAAKHGAAQADVDAVVAFAREHGLDVAEADPAARLVVLTGTVAAMSAAFHATLERYEPDDPASGRHPYRGRVGHVHVPAELEPVITVLTGLDDRRQVRPRPLMTHPQPDVRYGPADLAGLYSFPADLDGTGQCIGLLEFGGGYENGDLDTYFATMQVARPRVVSVSVDGTRNAPGGDADAEVVLDIEVAGGGAQGATIAVYFAQFTAAGWVEALTKAIHDRRHRPSVLSISWGWSEYEDAGTLAWTPQVIDEVDTMLAEAANLGITVLVAAGDDGSTDGIDDGKVHVDYAASSPYVLGCGGTTLYAKDGVREREVVWGNGVRAQGAGHGSTGGGVSEHFPLPDWQRGVDAPQSASTGHVGRCVPDVAAVADVRTGYAQYMDGEWFTDGGTSASAPLWAALIARCNQRLAEDGKRVGYINPVLYGTIGATGAFYDVTSGSNATLAGEPDAYTAGPGWDPCTGWGTPNGERLLAQL